MRKDLDDHLEDEYLNRDYTCKHCELEGTYVFITGDHDEVCPEKIIPCPNKDVIKKWSAEKSKDIPMMNVTIYRDPLQVQRDRV